jgi:transcription elongation factor Elf1
LGRRRKKTLRITRRTLPKVFACPRCGMITIRITSHEDETSQDTVFLVACGNLACGVRRELRYPTKRADIDVYNTFVDDFARAGA